MNIVEHIKHKYLMFDGAMGSMLQKKGLQLRKVPEVLNVEDPEIIEAIHLEYLENGAEVITTNTFGANRLKMKEQSYSLEKIISSAIKNARTAIKKSGKKAYIALDIGPIGQLLEPAGVLSFEEAYDIFKEIVELTVTYGADVFIVETMIDLLELKAAVLAVKENSNLPVFTTMTFEQNGRTLTGSSIETMVATLEGLRVDALGINCGFGPLEMLPLVEKIANCASIPIMVQANAGIPEMKDGKTVFPVDPEQFKEYMKDILNFPVQIVGGCCGTTPEHIRLLSEELDKVTFKVPDYKEETVVACPVKAVTIDKYPFIIGERINPTGKPLLKKSLREEQYDYILKEGILQEEQGAHAIDINVGMPEIDEAAVMVEIVKALQSVVRIPLQLDSSSPEVLERALRVYNGKALINSLNGKDEVLEAVLPLVKKYGGVVVGLCIDEKGLAYTAERKVDIAKKIIQRAEAYGVSKKDILIDPLTLTVSAQQEAVKATLDAITEIKKLGVKTILGASNVSFGLPNRECINTTFMSMAIYAGLDACIINPGIKNLMNTIAAGRILLNIDHECSEYISTVTESPKSEVKQESKTEYTFQETIIKCLKEEAKLKVIELLNHREPLDIIENEIVPALNIVGKRFEEGSLYLPQLIQSAETVSIAFNEIKKKYKNQASENEKVILLATVKGDVHDIGKNIVKVLLENYGYKVIDMGKDVDIEKIVETVKKKNIKLVGLSALMTTTVVNMDETIKALKKENVDIKIMVGGAVLNEGYAKTINADFYCKDALSGVDVAKQVLG